MEPGHFLKDVTRGESRFRIDRLLHAGKNYQIALAKDVRMDDRIVCVKAIEYDEAALSNPDYIVARHQTLRQEMVFLTLSSPLLPEPVDWLEIEGSPVLSGQPEPVLVYEYQPGTTLHELITTRHPGGLAHARALRFFRELVLFCKDIHAQGYVFRDFDPRHVIVGFDDILHLVGCGNAVERGERMNVFKMDTNPAYTAPEIRREISGKVVRQACDFYSLGCLLGFMVTGIEPLGRPEAPLEVEAYDRMKAELPVGLRLLIARCMQPLAQKRFPKAEELLPFCTLETLPEPHTPGFSLMEIPTPWSGPEGVDNRSLRSQLSPGPLISEYEPGGPKAAPGALVPAKETLPAAQEERGNLVRVAMILSALVFLMLVLGAVAFMVLQAL